jgi:hypothetical protein
MNKEEVIYNMCMTYRHDFGLRKNPNDPPWTAGMTEEDASMLYKTMEQIYTNDIEPLLQEFNDLKEGKRVQVPQSKEHAALMFKLASMYLGEDKLEIKRNED